MKFPFSLAAGFALLAITAIAEPGPAALPEASENHLSKRAPVPKGGRYRQIHHKHDRDKDKDYSDWDDKDKDKDYSDWDDKDKDTDYSDWDDKDKDKDYSDWDDKDKDKDYSDWDDDDDRHDGDGYDGDYDHESVYNHDDEYHQYDPDYSGYTWEDYCSHYPHDYWCHAYQHGHDYDKHHKRDLDLTQVEKRDAAPEAIPKHHTWKDYCYHNPHHYWCRAYHHRHDYDKHYKRDLDLTQVEKRDAAPEAIPKRRTWKDYCYHNPHHYWCHAYHHRHDYDKHHKRGLDLTQVEKRDAVPGRLRGRGRAKKLKAKRDADAKECDKCI